MYGKKRIAIENKTNIVLIGGKSYIPIGRCHNINNKIIGKLRNIDSWDLSLNESNSIDFEFNTLSELRNFVKETYKERLK
jgi:uncharacterized protein YlzI (FlbEa/FlbD family)